MTASNGNASDKTKFRIRAVIFVLLGVAVLVLKPRYSGPFEELVFAHAGNVAISFAVYFIIAPLFLSARFGKMLTAGLAFLAVQLFEATDGFGVMGNVYDRLDFAANTVGIGLAVLVDIAAQAIAGPRSAGPTGNRDH